MSTFRYITVNRPLSSDLHTPVSAYLKLRDSSVKSILMESSDYHTGSNARSFIAIEPIAEVSVSHGVGICSFPDGTVTERKIGPDFTVDELIGGFMREFEIAGKGASLWGFTSFNAVRYLEDIPVKDETKEKDDAPDILYILFRHTLEFDHFRNRLTLHEIIPKGEDPQGAKVEKLLSKAAMNLYDFRTVGEASSPLSDEQHKENIRKGIAHCKRGDTFQVVLSRRFVQRYEGDDFQLYRALRGINPSPYSRFELSPGIKDAEKVEKFLNELKA